MPSSLGSLSLGGYEGSVIFQNIGSFARDHTVSSQKTSLSAYLYVTIMSGSELSND